MRFIKEQNNLSEKSDTQRTLGGDLSLQQIESRIRTAVFTPVMTKMCPVRIGDLGVTFQRDGLLKLDQAKMEGELNKDYKKVAEALTGTYSLEGGKSKGFVDLLDETASTLLAPPTGVLPTRKNGLQSQINQIDRQIANRERVIAQKEEVLKAKFSRLEETVSRIRGQGAGIAGLANMAVLCHNYDSLSLIHGGRHELRFRCI